MLKIRHAIMMLGILSYPMASPAAQVSIGIGLPQVSIGINLSSYPQLIRVPGYPVYYHPQIDANYFFYDGMYWVFENDNWYASSWYNGPWGYVGPEEVPVFILRVPVRYYHHQPAYFRGWRHDAPPRWGDHWGRDWEQRRSGWNRWDRHVAPSPAPLPVYQRQYSGDRYPRQAEQQQLRQQKYRYQPRDPVVLQHYQARPMQGSPVQQQNRSMSEERGYGQQGQGRPDAQDQRHPQSGQRDQQQGTQGQGRNQSDKNAGRKPKPDQDEEME